MLRSPRTFRALNPPRPAHLPALLSALAAAVLAGCAAPPPVATGPAAPAPGPAPAVPKALVIGHRGASALRPEHTLASYQRAIDDGADVVEPDLVMTRDGVLVARHENEIGTTTNVAELPQFASRKRVKVIDGERLDGWFTEDFTLAELKTLRARERIAQVRKANTQYNDKFEIPTFDEIIDLVAKASQHSGRVIGLYPETKHPSYFRGIGLPLEEKLVATLQAHAYTRSAPVFVQSFETGNLREMHQRLAQGMPNVKLIQLMGGAKNRPADWRLAGDTRTYADMMTPIGLREVASYANGIGPEKSSVVPRDANGNLGTPTALVRNAHAAGLLVHPYTFRPENTFLPRNLRTGGGDATRSPSGMVREVQAFLAAGIDGFFTDDPALGRQAVDTPGR
ncbi:glycerophosphodiester phosphodiesterase [Cupriavidus basilensis]|uniref:glycerophosphodiester phosphodiesterase n=1 Tax=Cupriavidus basilensis TaxID=68895 RepID=A0A0C4Y4U3_9BURK|nr:glycerophosphodiester phosphodiesterase [Cupriavidus basilensis]AJG17970.1 Glycerophosphoryl diester phosphodiesterase [Cupriavidus basilensis]